MIRSLRPGLGVLLLVAFVPGILPSVAAASETDERLKNGFWIHGATDWSVDLGGSDPDGVAVEGVGDDGVAQNAGDGFPRRGSHYVVMSSGDAELAWTENSSSSLSGFLSGKHNPHGGDVVQVTVDFTWSDPAVDCLAVDFRFYSEEYPEYVGSAFNDAFTLELGQSDMSYSTGGVESPRNFAVDGEGRPISVNSSFAGPDGDVSSVDTDTTYDGSTPLLRAVTPLTSVTPGPVLSNRLILTIQDLGDAIYDSAAFVDNIVLTSGVDCDAGGTELLDTDGDALLDTWEVEGLDADGDGAIDVDLPAWGADPTVPDVFVHHDWMAGGGQDHSIPQGVITQVVDAFANAPEPIHLHVDNGPDTPTRWAPGRETLGELSTAGPLAFDEESALWGDVDAMKEQRLIPAGRERVFRYAVTVHNVPDNASPLKHLLGLARGIPHSDFVQMGRWATGKSDEHRANLFMHELGHTLGLRHGGSDNLHGKPNYLSVMNYRFVRSGLVDGGTEGHTDFSRSTLRTISEDGIDESVGFGAAGSLWARWDCDVFNPFTGPQQEGPASGALDWDCDGSIDTSMTAPDFNKLDPTDTPTFTGFDDWASISFRGGVVGAAASGDVYPFTPLVPEDEAAQAPPASTELEVVVPEPSSSTPICTSTTVDVLVRNIGLRDVTASVALIPEDGVAAAADPTVHIPVGEEATLPVELTPSSFVDGARTAVRVVPDQAPGFAATGSVFVTTTGQEVVTADPTVASLAAELGGAACGPTSAATAGGR